MDDELELGTLFERLTDELDTEALKPIVTALRAGSTARGMDRILRGALPADAVVAAGLLATSSPGVQMAGRVVVTAGAAVASGHYLETARQVRALGRMERQAATTERWDVALYVCSARISLMELLLVSRTRTAIATLRALRYAAALDNTELLRLTADALNAAIGRCSPRGLQRVQQAAITTAEELGPIPSPAARGSARTLLWDAFDDCSFAGRGEIAIQAATDYSELAVHVGSDLIDHEGGTVATYVMVEASEEPKQDPIAEVLWQSRKLLGSGLAEIVAETNPEVGDAWVRKLVRKGELPLPLILDSYADAMESTGDDRLPTFRDCIAGHDLEYSGALHMLGLETGSTRDDLGR